MHVLCEVRPNSTSKQNKNCARGEDHSSTAPLQGLRRTNQSNQGRNQNHHQGPKHCSHKSGLQCVRYLREVERVTDFLFPCKRRKSSNTQLSSVRKQGGLYRAVLNTTTKADFFGRQILTGPTIIALKNRATILIRVNAVFQTLYLISGIATSAKTKNSGLHISSKVKRRTVR